MESRLKEGRTMKSEHGVLDIPRESKQRQRRMRRIIYSAVGIAAIAGITVFLSRLKPAAPTVDKTAIWVDTVQKGTIVITVKGLGALLPPAKSAKAPSNSTAVRLKVPAARWKDLRPGEAAMIDTHNGIIPGRVVAIAPIVFEGLATVNVQLDGPAPKGMSPGQAVEGSIEVGRLDNVTYVSRPVFGQPNTTVSLFKLDPDGKGASLVKVQLGRASANSIEVLSGLQPADKVILSDMSAWDSFNRIRLE